MRARRQNDCVRTRLWYIIENSEGAAAPLFGTEMEELRFTVARNLAQCRRACGYTQLQVAEKLNYSDKAVSKWERGESLPDVAVLAELARLYGVTLDYLIQDANDRKAPPAPGRIRRRILVAVMSCLLVWVVAVAAYFLALMCGAHGPVWLAFIWALPACGILCVVFAGVWGNKYLRTAAVSFLLWTAALALYLSVPVPYNWSVFVLAALLQALAVFWFLLRAPRTGTRR